MTSWADGLCLDPVYTVYCKYGLKKIVISDFELQSLLCTSILYVLYMPYVCSHKKVRMDRTKDTRVHGK